MHMPYPLKAVICSHPQLARQYDAHPASIDLISGCLTPARLKTLLDDGAIFDAIIFINGEGEQFGVRLLGQEGDEADCAQLQSLRLDASAVQAVDTIHAAFARRDDGDFIVAGG